MTALIVDHLPTGAGTSSAAREAGSGPPIAHSIAAALVIFGQCFLIFFLHINELTLRGGQVQKAHFANIIVGASCGYVLLRDRNEFVSK